MDCEAVQRTVLDLGWDQADRSRIGQVLAHLESCEQCQAAAGDYDRMRSLLALPCEGEPVGGWEAMEGRLQARVGCEGRVTLFGRLGRIAAVVLVGLATFMLGQHVRRPAISPPGVGAAMPGISAGEIAHEVKAFGELSNVFDHRVSWVLMSNGDTDMGLADESAPAGRKLLVLRLAMFQGSELASRADLAIVPGRSAEATVSLAEGRKLRYQVCTSSRQPEQLSLWVEVQGPQGGPTLAALATSLRLEPSQRVRAGQLVTSTGAYDLQLSMAEAALPRNSP